jgi:hypothetical protein
MSMQFEGRNVNSQVKYFGVFCYGDTGEDQFQNVMTIFQLSQLDETAL